MENRAFQHDTCRPEADSRDCHNNTTNGGIISPVAPSEINQKELTALEPLNGTIICSCGPDCKHQIDKNDPKNYNPKVEHISWTAGKCRLFSVIVICLGIWAAIYFTLSSYGYV